MEWAGLVIDGFPGRVFYPISMEEIAMRLWSRRGERKQGRVLRVRGFRGRVWVKREECGVEVEEQTGEENDPREDGG